MVLNGKINLRILLVYFNAVGFKFNNGCVIVNHKDHLWPSLWFVFFCYEVILFHHDHQLFQSHRL